MLRTDQIINKQFAPAGRGVYNAQEVDDFVKAVAASYEQLSNENSELIKKISILADKVEEYRRDEEAITAALLTAHRMAEIVRREASESAQSQLSIAESKSHSLVDEATKQAQDIVEEAKASAKDIVVNAREAVAALSERAKKETDAAIADANTRAAAIVADANARGAAIVADSEQKHDFYHGELARIADETAQYKAKIKALFEEQLRSIDSIPALYVAPAAQYAPAADGQPVINDEPEAAAELEVFTAPEETVVPEPAAEPEAEAAPDFFDSIVIPELQTQEEDESPAEQDDDGFDLLFDDEQSVEAPLSIDEIPAFKSMSFSSESSEPEAETAQEDTVDFADDDDEEFNGFKVNLDDIDGDDDDIGSLFDKF